MINIYKFSGMANDYSKYRPNYARETIECLKAEVPLTPQSIIADVGSGTGKFSRLLLDEGFTVYGVEPNPDMRRKAEDELYTRKNFISVSGTSENSTLPNDCVDLITVAQAFHWFDVEKFLMECNRILKEPGYVAIDDCDGNVTENVKVTGSVDTSKKGTYELTYSVSDEYGNETKVNRIVKVLPKNEFLEVRKLLQSSYNKMFIPEPLPENRFGRKDFIYGLRSISIADPKMKQKMLDVASLLPQSADSAHAFIVKYSQPYKIVHNKNGEIVKVPRDSEEIGLRLLMPSVGTDDHIHPQKAFRAEEAARIVAEQQAQAQQEAAARPQLPTEIDVRLYRPTAKGPVLADASVTLNGCFAIRGIQIRAGQNGPFVSMPSRQVHGEYRDICFPCTSEFRQTFDQAVLDAYRMEISQMAQPAQKQDGSMGGMSM